MPVGITVPTPFATSSRRCRPGRGKTRQPDIRVQNWRKHASHDCRLSHSVAGIRGPVPHTDLVCVLSHLISSTRNQVLCSFPTAPLKKRRHSTGETSLSHRADRWLKAGLTQHGEHFRGEQAHSRQGTERLRRRHGCLCHNCALSFMSLQGAYHGDVSCSLSQSCLHVSAL